jgi:hypothetical protein
MKSKLALAVIGALSTAPAVACYTVYDRSNTIVYYAEAPPVDMTPPFTERLQKNFPGSHLVFGSGTGCPATQAGYNPTRPQADSAPLFTDEQTAKDLKLSHRMLPNGTAMVAHPPPSLRPGFTVMNLGGAAGNRSAPPGAPADKGAAAKSSPVITEMRNPPITVIQGEGPATEVR